MPKDKTKPIKGIVQGVLKGWKKDKVFKKDLIEKAWRKIAGKKAMKHTKIASLRSGRLIIEVDESAWIYQLSMKKHDLLKSMNEVLEKKDIPIKEIQFRIGTFN